MENKENSENPTEKTKLSYYQRNKERVKENTRKSQEKNKEALYAKRRTPEHLERMKKYRKTWYNKNIERQKEYYKTYYIDHILDYKINYEYKMIDLLNEEGAYETFLEYMNAYNKLRRYYIKNNNWHGINNSIENDK